MLLCLEGSLPAACMVVLRVWGLSPWQTIIQCWSDEITPMVQNAYQRYLLGQCMAAGHSMPSLSSMPDSGCPADWT